MVGDISNSVRDGQHLVCLGVGDLDAELLLDSHHYFYSVKRVQIQVLLESGSGGDLSGVDLTQKTPHMRQGSRRGVLEEETRNNGGARGNRPASAGGNGS